MEEFNRIVLSRTHVTSGSPAMASDLEDRPGWDIGTTYDRKPVPHLYAILCWCKMTLDTRLVARLSDSMQRLD
jgi:hypothetical protein